VKDKSGKHSDKTAEMGFIDHLEELRWRIIKSLICIVIFGIISFIFSDFFIDLLLKPSKYLNPDMTLQVLKVQGMLVLKIWVGVVMGIVFSIPVIVYQIWAFVSPGLYESEKKWSYWLVISVTVFFVLGAIFAYFVIIPFALRFLIGIGVPEVEKNISINYYVKFVIQLMIAAGLIFQMPILSFILTKMGLITPKFLRKYWRHAMIVILILSAFITPPDPISMIMMAIPLLFLYEFSIFISRIAMREQEENEENLAG
jgi:sec-independent protein translocase protein TatC